VGSWQSLFVLRWFGWLLWGCGVGEVGWDVWDRATRRLGDKAMGRQGEPVGKVCAVIRSGVCAVIVDRQGDKATRRLGDPFCMVRRDRVCAVIGCAP